MKLDPKKIKKMSRILRIIINVLFWAIIVIGIVTCAACVVALIVPDDVLNKLFSSGKLSIQMDYIGFLSYKVDPYMYNESELKSFFLPLIPAIAVGITMSAIVFKQISGILKTIENDCPFEEKNTKRITIIGIMFLIGSILNNLAKCIIVENIINIFYISNINVKYSIDGTMLITGFLILILAGVFKYGNFLQKEYDSTL